MDATASGEGVQQTGLCGRDAERRDHPKTCMGNAGNVERLAIVPANGNLDILGEHGIRLPWCCTRLGAVLSVALGIEMV